MNRPLKFTPFNPIAILALVACSIPLALAQTKDVTPQERRAFFDKYCITCHNEKARVAGLLLDKANTSNLLERPDIWEKVIWKLRAGAMPPLVASNRPDEATVNRITGSLEDTLDHALLANPNPGRKLIHRLNRVEYANAVRDVLGVDIDRDALLPADSSSYGFDNNADTLTVSPVLLEKYLSAADKISILAMGDPKSHPVVAKFPLRFDLSQNERMEGMPLGTSGGARLLYNFPADGEYVLRGTLYQAHNSSDRGEGGEDIPTQFEISVDGKRVLLTHFGGKEEEWTYYRGYMAQREEIAKRMVVKTFVKAGVHSVNFTFINRKINAMNSQELFRPTRRSNLDGSDAGGPAQLENVLISGPYNATGVSETASRKKILICKPTPGLDETQCAKRILSAMARRGYRRPANDADLETLLSYYQRGRNRGTFDDGIRLAVAALLTNANFLFRIEMDPPGLAPTENYRISDLELASRLSFFLWSTVPDDELLDVAIKGKLKDPAIFEQQVRRMLADKRAHELVSNFTGQWLGLRALPNVTPDILVYLDFDDQLRRAFRTETEMLFESVMREDRNIFDLLTADYTFVNERLARHYGMQGVYGTEFRRVPVTDDNRRGILGQASILTLSSNPTRTSPVKRGKWILSTLVSLPPPPPPPNVPPLTENGTGAPKSVRERMEQHRANAFCAGCHRTIDPVGFSLENFNPIGEWRSTTEDGKPVDASGQLWDGTVVSRPADLRQAILKRPNLFAGTLTERLLTYALGRGVDPSEMYEVRAIDREAAKNNYKFSSIVMGIVKSPQFQMRSGRASEPDLNAAVREFTARQ